MGSLAEDFVGLKIYECDCPSGYTDNHLLPKLWPTVQTIQVLINFIDTKTINSDKTHAAKSLYRSNFLDTDILLWCLYRSLLCTWVMQSTLIKKKIKRMEQLLSHIWLTASSYIWGNIWAFPHILGSLSSFKTLQLYCSPLWISL